MDSTDQMKPTSTPAPARAFPDLKSVITVLMRFFLTHALLEHFPYHMYHLGTSTGISEYIIYYMFASAVVLARLELSTLGFVLVLIRFNCIEMEMEYLAMAKIWRILDPVWM
ncbi:hypothetical protein P280DRAFT_548823 [Massarina eburnea CBS 473.64]|uniref:Uncharacterized protein n=1 Tax=Massarina eburnea CBS 473.64 TaxID=1395130 RepID=A0A6A6S3P4_9PLEO|nr:hypothetical protein P280DRAFT_548823 [Massarina eburnea CBS 473.64]